MQPATKELSSTLTELWSDIVEVVMLIAPPHLPPALETNVAVEVKVTVKVTESLNSANQPCSSLRVRIISLLDGAVNCFFSFFFLQE